MSPVRPGPSNSREAIPQVLSGSSASSGWSANSAKAINAVSTQPTVQNRLRKLPRTRPTRAFISVLAEPPPVAMKWGCTTMPTRLITTTARMKWSGNSLALVEPRTWKCSGRHLLVHDLEALHQALRAGVAELVDQSLETIRNQDDRQENDTHALDEICKVRSA